MADIVKLHRSVRPSSQWQVWAGSIEPPHAPTTKFVIAAVGSLGSKQPFIADKIVVHRTPYPFRNRPRISSVSSPQ
ncbi:hypothetical protein SAMN04488011_107162 [Palleronia pelagia]|uniref:Uncharacterized protein n=1 Tax=Palleronia pelagia TaxID=387096 RepID=A0A1H8K9P7_9RHOB|nr:hypothetical protein SAMN04488011_107162 [Palleronia pelagia]